MKRGTSHLVKFLLSNILPCAALGHFQACGAVGMGCGVATVDAVGGRGGAPTVGAWGEVGKRPKV